MTPIDLRPPPLAAVSLPQVPPAVLISSTKLPQLDKALEPMPASSQITRLPLLLEAFTASPITETRGFVRMSASPSRTLRRISWYRPILTSVREAIMVKNPTTLRIQSSSTRCSGSTTNSFDLSSNVTASLTRSRMSGTSSGALLAARATSMRALTSTRRLTTFRRAMRSLGRIDYATTWSACRRSSARATLTSSRIPTFSRTSSATFMPITKSLSSTTLKRMCGS